MYRDYQIIAGVGWLVLSLMATIQTITLSVQGKLTNQRTSSSLIDGPAQTLTWRRPVCKLLLPKVVEC